MFKNTLKTKNSKYVITLFVILFAFVFSAKNVSAAVIAKPSNFLILNNGLIGYWTFDGKDTVWTSQTTGTTIDKSGNGRNGTITNMNQALSPVVGKIGQALGFGYGNSEYISVSPQTFIEGLNYLTISFWMKPKLARNGGSDTLMSNYNNSAQSTVALSRTNNGYIEFAVRTSSTKTAQSGWNVVADTNWHHVVCIYDGVQIYIYVDGVQSGTPVAQTGTTMDTYGSLKIQTDNQVMDEVRIYDRVLSAAEIKNLYNSGGSKVAVTQGSNISNGGLSSGLVGWWTFDGKDTPWTSATAATAIDKSGNGNTGTLQNMNQEIDPVSGKIGQALSFDGVADYVSTATSFVNPQVFTISAWFKTTSASGKKIIGFESNQTGTASVSYDRHLYMGTNGKIYFGWYSGSIRTIVSGANLNDGKWHHVVGTHSGTAGTLYVDGVSQGVNTTSPESFTGYWRIGGYKLNTWTNATNGYFDGAIDDVRIYNRVISGTEVLKLYNIGR